jgi:hypothetical protein
MQLGFGISLQSTELCFYHFLLIRPHIIAESLLTAVSIEFSCSRGSPCSSSPRLAASVRDRSSLVLATIFILLLSVLPLSFLFHTAQRTFPARCSAAPCASGARPRSARVPCSALCCPALRGTVQRGERVGQHRERARSGPRVPAPF